MKHRFLEVTFRNGRPVAAYLYLPRRSGDAGVRTERREEGLIIDFAPDGRAIGIEITSPRGVSLTTLNRVLAEINQPPATGAELAPLAAA